MSRERNGRLLLDQDCLQWNPPVHSDDDDDDDDSVIADNSKVFIIFVCFSALATLHTTQSFPIISASCRLRGCKMSLLLTGQMSKMQPNQGCCHDVAVCVSVRCVVSKRLSRLSCDLHKIVIQPFKFSHTIYKPDSLRRSSH